MLEQLRQAAGDAPLPPLSLGAPTRSLRPGPIGRGVSAVRAGILRLIAPALGDLIGQLERDRHRERAELRELRERIERLEAERR